MSLKKSKKMTNKEITGHINNLTQTLITVHNTNLQIGNFISDYIDWKGDTDDFKEHIEKLQKSSQTQDEEGVEDGEQK